MEVPRQNQGASNHRSQVCCSFLLRTKFRDGVLTWSLLHKFEIYLGRYFSDCSCLFERRVTFCCLHVKCNFELSNIAFDEFDAVIFCRTCSRDSRICLNHRTRLTIHLHGHLNDLVSNEIQASGGLFEMILPSWSDLKKPATHGCPNSLSLSLSSAFAFACLTFSEYARPLELL